MPRTILSALCLAVPLLSCGSVAAAQFRRPHGSVTPPPATLVAPDDPLAVELNPGAIPFLSAWGATYVHAEAHDRDDLLGRGDAVYLAAPLPFGLGVGVSAEHVRPTDALGLSPRGRLSLALAAAPSPTLGLGLAVRYAASHDPTVDGLASLDLGATLRPSSRLGLSLVARDLSALFGFNGNDAEPETSFLGTAALRPYGVSSLTLEGGLAVDTAGRFGARGALVIAIPHVGSARAVLELEDMLESGPDVRVVSGLEVRWGTLGVGGGTLVGDGLDAGPGYYLSAHVGGAVHRGLPTPKYVLNLEVRGSVGRREIMDLVRRLDGALADDRVSGVLLRLRSSDIGLAYAQELRLMIDALEKDKKPVVCHLDAASGSEYYACAAGRHTLLDPAGGIRLVGSSSEVLLLSGLLERVGLHADFVRIGRYKSAPEQLENRESSEPARFQRSALLDDVTRRLVGDLARDLDMSEARVRAAIDGGPYATPEALAAGLATGEGDEHELGKLLASIAGLSAPLRDGPPRRARRHFGVARRIGVVVIDGNIVDGDNVDLPFVGIHTSGGRTVTRAIEQLAQDRSVAAIVLRVDSPGGSALASDQIWRAVRRARKKKPVIASMGAVAASGGYYAAVGADEIWADPSTVTGSIGIFFGKVDVSGLAERLGVRVEELRRGKRSGADSIFRPYTDDERAMYAEKIRLWYRLFLERVAEGRGMDVSRVHELAEGRIYSGDAALGVGLVDHLGGYGSALARARVLGGLDADAEVEVLPGRPTSLLDYVLGKPRAAASLPPSVRAAAAVATTMAHVGDGMPLALMPITLDVR